MRETLFFYRNNFGLFLRSEMMILSRSRRALVGGRCLLSRGLRFMSSEEPRAWHEPKVLFRSVAAFRDKELEVLEEFAKTVSSAVDTKEVSLEREALERAVAAAEAALKVESSREERSLFSLSAFCEALPEDSPRSLACRSYARHLALATIPDRALARTRFPVDTKANDAPWTGLYEAAVRRYLNYSKRAKEEEETKNAFPFMSSEFDAKLLGALRAWAFGDWRDRAAAQFALDDDDDDGLLEPFQVQRTVDALTLPLGPALAAFHEVQVPQQLPAEKKRLLRIQRRDAAKRLRGDFFRHKLDVRAKARSLAAWADRAKTDTVTPPSIASVAWLLGTAPKDKAYVDVRGLHKAIDDFFPELNFLAKAAADDLTNFRTDYWRQVEENRTSQYLVALFVLLCALTDYAIMCA